MKIYFIGQKGIPVKSGGVEHHVENAAIRLAYLGYDVFVYTRFNYSNKRRKNYKGVNLINLPSIGLKNLDAITHTFLATLDVLRRPADVIHFHSIGPSSLLWLVKLLKPKTVVIATFHSQCYRHKKWSAFARWYLQLGERILCRFADEVIVPSRILSYYMEHRYQREPIYIPNGVSMPNRVGRKSIKKWELRKDDYILCVGRLVRHKGIHYLIEAYNSLNTQKKLVIVGDGAFTDDYVQELKGLAGGNKNIIFTGSQSGRTLSELYANAYCFVQPSESEGLSVALLEAMSYGLPVIVSNIAENKEAINHAGCVFKSGNVVDLKQVLSKVLRQPAVASRMGAKALGRIKQNYNWDILIFNIISVYKQALFAEQRKYMSRKIAPVRYSK